MAIVKARVSVVRIPRHSLKPINATENHDDIEEYPTVSHVKPPEKRHSNKKEQIIADQSPVVRQPSAVKSEDLNNHLSKSSPTIQSQPRLTDDWMKRSSNNPVRPELTWKAQGQWSHGLFSLSDDYNMCCYACACWCCFRHEISSMMGEHWCLWFLNCNPLTELRVKFRQQYGIQGSIANDCCVSTFCPLCVGLQLAKEGREHGHRIFRK